MEKSTHLENDRSLLVMLIMLLLIFLYNLYFYFAVMKAAMNDTQKYDKFSKGKYRMQWCRFLAQWKNHYTCSQLESFVRHFEDVTNCYLLLFPTPEYELLLDIQLSQLSKYHCWHAAPSKFKQQLKILPVVQLSFNIKPKFD